jgi:osmotically-inducible protein OsmY
MRFGLALLAFILLSGCTALVVGGTGAGGYQAGKDEREPAVATADSAISARINGRNAADPVVNAFSIGVLTHKGTVTLTGTVGNFAARDQAGRIAKDTDGVVIVNNQIVVDDQSDPK